MLNIAVKYFGEDPGVNGGKPLPESPPQSDPWHSRAHSYILYKPLSTLEFDMMELVRFAIRAQGPCKSVKLHGKTLDWVIFWLLDSSLITRRNDASFVVMLSADLSLSDGTPIKTPTAVPRFRNRAQVQKCSLCYSSVSTSWGVGKVTGALTSSEPARAGAQLSSPTHKFTWIRVVMQCRPQLSKSIYGEERYLFPQASR